MGHFGFDTETYQGYVKCLAVSDAEGSHQAVLETQDTDALLAFVHAQVERSGERYGCLWNLGFDTAALVKDYVVHHQDDLRRQHYRKIRVKKEAGRLAALAEAEGGLTQGQRSELKALLLELDGMETVERFDTDRFHVELVGSKGFGIRPLNQRKHAASRWLFDASGFYVEGGHGGMRLESAAARYLGEHKTDEALGISRAAIGSEAGYYERRRDDIVSYCLQDARLTARLMERTIQGFERLGFPFPDKPFSKGSVSKAVLRDRGTLEGTQREYERLRLSAYAPYWVKSFQGGVFLLRGAGDYPNCYQVDINSAYPWALAGFPSLEGAIPVDWADPRFQDAAFRFFKVRLVPTPRVALKERKSTRKIYRWGGDPVVVYLTEPDVQALQVYGDPFEILDAVGVVAPSPDRPFGWLLQEFARKSQIKVEFGGESVEYLNIKIVLNGCYGIVAQRRPRESQFTNLIYAAYTTALCRRELWKAAHDTEALGDRILQYATDGLLVQDLSQGAGRRAWEGRASKDLGGWDLESQVHATLFETGVYLVHGKDGKPGKLKRRGFPDLTEAILRACGETTWTSQREAPIKLRPALIQRRTADIGVFFGVDRTLAPVQAAADAGFQFPRSFAHAPLKSYFDHQWAFRLQGEP